MNYGAKQSKMDIAERARQYYDSRLQAYQRNSRGFGKSFPIIHSNVLAA